MRRCEVRGFQLDQKAKSVCFCNHPPSPPHPPVPYFVPNPLVSYSIPLVDTTFPFWLFKSPTTPPKNISIPLAGVEVGEDVHGGLQEQLSLLQHDGVELVLG